MFPTDQPTPSWPPSSALLWRLKAASPGLTSYQYPNCVVIFLQKKNSGPFDRRNFDQSIDSHGWWLWKCNAFATRTKSKTRDKQLRRLLLADSSMKLWILRPQKKHTTKTEPTFFLESRVTTRMSSLKRTSIETK